MSGAESDLGKRRWPSLGERPLGEKSGESGERGVGSDIKSLVCLSNLGPTAKKKPVLQARSVSTRKSLCENKTCVVAACRPPIPPFGWVLPFFTGHSPHIYNKSHTFMIMSTSVTAQQPGPAVSRMVERRACSYVACSQSASVRMHDRRRGREERHRVHDARGQGCC